MTHPLTLYRKKHQLTLEAFGLRIGATKGMISKWEAGKTMPRARIMGLIVAVTDGEVSADQLLNAFNAPSRCSEAAE